MTTNTTPSGFLHLVYFYPAEGAGPNDAAQLMEGCRKHLTGIPGVLRLELGHPAGTARSVVDNTYAVGMLVEFADDAAQEVYEHHPDHLRFIAECSRFWGRVQVYDTLIERSV